MSFPVWSIRVYSYISEWQSLLHGTDHSRQISFNHSDQHTLCAMALTHRRVKTRKKIHTVTHNSLLYHTIIILYDITELCVTVYIFSLVLIVTPTGMNQVKIKNTVEYCAHSSYTTAHSICILFVHIPLPITCFVTGSRQWHHVNYKRNCKSTVYPTFQMSTNQIQAAWYTYTHNLLGHWFT